MKKPFFRPALLLLAIPLGGGLYLWSAIRPLSLRPWPCGDEQTCASACERGDPVACTERALLMSEGALLPLDLPAAKALLDRACHRDGFALACSRLLSLLELTNDADEGRREELASRVEQLSRRACLGAEAEACSLVASGLQKKEASARDHERGRELQDRVDDAYLRACRGGDAHACTEMNPKVASSVRELLLDLCSKKDAQACSRLAYLRYNFKHDANFFSFLEQSCQLGSAEDCVAGVTAATNHTNLRDKERLTQGFRQRAAELLGARCQANAVRACSAWVEHASDAAWPASREVFFEIATHERKLLDEACRQGDRWSCTTLAERFAGGVGDLPFDAEKAIFTRKKAVLGATSTCAPGRFLPSVRWRA